MFGPPREIPQRETTPFAPTTPYAISKVFAFSMAKAYRAEYGMFIVNGILFNHESERRGTMSHRLQSFHPVYGH